MKKLFYFLLNFWKTLTIIFLFIFGLAFIFWILYNRLRQRIPVDILHEYDGVRLFIYSYLCLLNLIFLLSAIIELLFLYNFIKIHLFSNKEKLDNHNSFLSRLILIIKQIFQLFNIISKGLNAVYIYGIKNLPKYDDFREKSCYFIYNHMRLIGHGIPIIIFTCQFIVIIALLLDVFYFQQFNFFYKSLILLLIPSGLLFWTFTVNEYALESIAYHHTFVNITLIDEDRCHYDFEYKPTHNPEEFQEFINAHFILRVVVRTIRIMKIYLVYQKALVFNAIRFFLYFITWSYLIFIMFF